jgi:hypothetical protein
VVDQVEGERPVELAANLREQSDERLNLGCSTRLALVGSGH